MSNQAFHATQRLGEGEHAQSFDECARACFPAVQLEAHHGAEAGLLSARDVVTGMSPQTRVIHVPYLRMTGEQFYERCRILEVCAHPRVQRADTS